MYQENMKDYKPKSRTRLRIALGKQYFTLKKKITWLNPSMKYAQSISNDSYPYLIFSHQTPLYRVLKDVDMWYQENKVNNLNIAIKKINHVVIKPGERFSFWKLIGKPSYEKGYLDGMVLNSGQLDSGVGGGLCQLTNMIYWMTIHTPLTVTQRFRHDYDVFPDNNRTQPFGSGATCVYNYRDLEILNETSEVYQFSFEITDQWLKGKVLSSKEKYFNIEVYEKDATISQEFWGGYMRHNKIYAKTFDLNGQCLSDLCVAENHAIMMYPPFIESGQ